MGLTRRRCAGLVGVLGYLGVLVLDTGSRLAVVVDDVGNLLSPAVAVGFCWAASRRLTGRHRLSWVLFTCFAATWAVGQGAWVWCELLRGQTVPFPGLPDIGYVASVPFLLLALVTHPDAPRLTSGRLRLTVDAVLIGASLFVLAWRVALAEEYRSAGAHGLAQVLGLTYPLLDVVVLSALLLVAARARGVDRRPFGLIAVCLAAGSVGNLAYGVMVQNGSWQPGGPVDAAWGMGFLFLAAGAWTDTGRTGRSTLPPSAPVKATLLPYLPLAVVLTVAVRDALANRPIDRVGRLVGMVIFASIVLRQLLALLENSRLTRGLEETVAVRTEALRRTSEQLQRQAWSDPLTGLPNRARLFDLAEAALACGPAAVALLDLDGFKGVNDSHGHAAGDTLLTVVGERLAAALPPGATAARLGGDEFAFLLPGCDDEATARARSATLLAVLDQPVVVGGRSLVLTGSLGVAVSGSADTPSSMLRNADIAMYAAKAAGKDQVRVFEPSMRHALLARVALEADLRLALQEGAVVPWFQPVVDLQTGQLTGVEALARWPRESGLVPPSEFVPLAEKCGLIALLGTQVLRASCYQAAAWNTGAWTDGAGLTLAVNLSAVQLASEDLVDTVRDALADSGLDPSRLILEITETVLMDDVEAAGPRLAALRALGVRIALDDFGTGWSSLGYLRSIPVDIVKIDRTFVQEVHLGPRQSALAAAVMTLARSLELEVVAEGIELPAQATRLRELGCRLAQGFLYSPAVPAHVLSAFLENPGDSFNGDRGFAFSVSSEHSC